MTAQTEFSAAAPVPDAGLAAILERQRAAFLADGPPPAEARRAALNRLKSALIAHRAEIEAALTADFGHRSRHETGIMEIMPVVTAIDYLLKNLKRFMKPEKRHVVLTMRAGQARVEYQPLGVVGIIAPWNYPLQLALLPLATALAAGNRAMVKMSELTPASAALAARLIPQIFAQEEVAIVTGDAETGAAFAGLPFDHLLFTGGTGIGRKVMAAAAQNLVPVTLELGGKSPAILAAGQDLDRAAASIAYGKLANSGQTCIATDYVLVPRAEIGAFAEAYDRAVKALYPEGPAGTDYSSIVNARHHARLSALVEEARAGGAEIRPVGHHPQAAEGLHNKMAPTLVLGATDGMRILQEEIFGPVLPVIGHDGIDDAIAYVNARPRPLALYFFGPEGAERDRVLSRTVSGNVTVNGTLLHVAQDDLPFGGVGPSGMGAYHGIEGFRAMSHAKGVFVQGRWNIATMLRPPFGPRADKILAGILKPPKG
ncbi:coniferyl aldehyde dehydrogenase [Mangrovicoccus algicola]|uniref:Aldehyde dehydrogenase n=1 Tax=Mangrovicoccus algicola TaxID=2771008 RepID=A0A8J7CVL2_9RHOB|nr:coniferyl aldehyde dehydrogenase [Mangrovicoccus algicola]MBE3638864.1 coniferyl aldehyde dehydrogenase [Mangrovicoccus algicola]